jgi:hypothetical protein
LEVLEGNKENSGRLKKKKKVSMAWYYNIQDQIVFVLQENNEEKLGEMRKRNRIWNKLIYNYFVS